MATSFSQLDIINAALLGIGEEEVSINDGSPAWRTLSAKWPSIVEAELETGFYDFTLIEANIVTRVAGKYGFNDGFQIPAAAVHIRRAWIQEATTNTLVVAGLAEDQPAVDRLMLNWVADSDYIYVNSADGVWIEYFTVPNPDKFSPAFVNGLTLKMQAVALRSLREEYGEARRLDDDAEMHFMKARTSSSRRRSQTPVHATESRYAQARFSRLYRRQ